MQGRHTEALEEMRKALRLSGNEINILAQLGVTHALAGRRAEAGKVAERVLDEGRRRGFVPAFRLSEIYLVWSRRTKDTSG